MVEVEAAQEWCRHCEAGKVKRPRGLCSCCYYSPGVRGKYLSVSKYGRRGCGGGNKLGVLAGEATGAGPGSLEKIRVMQGRAMRGESLFHPDDSRVPAPENGSFCCFAVRKGCGIRYDDWNDWGEGEGLNDGSCSGGAGGESSVSEVVAEVFSEESEDASGGSGDVCAVV